MDQNKVFPDEIRNDLIRKGLSFQQAMGISLREIKNRILDHLIDGGSVLVLFGPPGSGKTTFIKRHLKPDKDLIILETTGINNAINAFLLRMPRARMHFIMLDIPRDVCEARVRNRPPCEMDKAPGGGIECVLDLVNSWFARYNSPNEQENGSRLPIERKIRWNKE